MGYFDAIDALHRELMSPASAEVTEPPRSGETDEERDRRIAREGAIHTINHAVYEAARGTLEPHPHCSSAFISGQRLFWRAGLRYCCRTLSAKERESAEDALQTAR